MNVMVEWTSNAEARLCLYENERLGHHVLPSLVFHSQLLLPEKKAYLCIDPFISDPNMLPHDH